jgi:hypothetical protein
VARKKDINLEGRLVLHAWANDLFGYADTREMLSDLERADEGFDGEGRSGVFYRLRSRSDKLKVSLADLELYDESVRRHLDAINHKRPEPVTLRYFQHLAALYAEVFLDRWSHGRRALADELNAFAARLEEPVVFAAEDLNNKERVSRLLHYLGHAVRCTEEALGRRVDQGTLRRGAHTLRG